MHISNRILSLPTYVFAAIDEARDALREQGIEPIDFGVGDHTLPSPDVARERIKTAVDEFATTGYPSYVGSAAYRDAVAAWMRRRFGVSRGGGADVGGSCVGRVRPPSAWRGTLASSTGSRQGGGRE